MFIAFMNLTRDSVVACPLKNNGNKTLASMFYIILLHMLLKLVIHSFVFADCLDNPFLGIVESVVVHPLLLQSAVYVHANVHFLQSFEYQSVS